MKRVGAFEAKTHLSALLEEVAGGAEIEITRRGVAIARLVPARGDARADAADTIARMRAFARGQTLGRVGWKTLRDEGRR